MPPLGDVEQQIARKIVSHFLRSKAPTSERSLLAEFKQPDVIENMLRWGVLKSDSTREALLPTALAFEYCDDRDALALAKQGIKIVLTVFESLFSSDWDKKQFTLGDIKERAILIFGAPLNVDAFELGLYLIQEFGVLNGWVSSQQGEISNVQINKIIVTYDTLKIENAWDQHMRLQSQYVGTTPEPIRNVYERMLDMKPNEGDTLTPEKKRGLKSVLIKPSVIVAIIGLIGVIGAALIQSRPWQQPHSAATPVALHIAGTVVDSDTNQGIGQAQISLSGRTETSVTEDNGNFRIDFAGNEEEARRLRIRVNKKGYKTYDQSVMPPVDNFMIPLQKP